MNILLQARPPFNFHSVVHSHGWYQLAPDEADEGRGVLTRVEQLDTGRVSHLLMSGTLDGVAIEVQGRLRKREEQDIAEKVAWMFMLDADFDEFYALADQEPRLAHCRERAHGRLLRSSTLWEDVVKVMMTTNIQWSGTKRLVAQLVHHFGEPLPTVTTDAPRIRCLPCQRSSRAAASPRCAGWGWAIVRCTCCNWRAAS